MIENKVIKQDWINLSDLKWIQGNLKKLEPKNFEKLITSIKENGIIKSFHVWQNPSTNETWCLDGNHLKKALEKIKESGVGIPEKVKADFIDCQDEKHAKKLVLLYSAVYANVTEQGLSGFIIGENIDFDSLSKEIRIPEIDIEDLIKGINGGSNNPIKPEIEISPELFERHDYLVFYFDNEFDWQVACEKYQIKNVIDNNKNPQLAAAKGIGRVLSGKILI
jgi:hypothetical protein